MSLLRTHDIQTRYNEYLKTDASKTCALCGNKPLKVFKHWKIMENNFPYDIIATTHNMVVPLRHVREDELNSEEMEELLKIKNEVLHKEYDFFIEATYKIKSIPNHYHLHLIKVKDLSVLK